MEAPRVHVKNGWLLGLAKPGVQAFLGVPYAKPPLGDLRFLPPQPSEDWQGDYPTTQYSDGPCNIPIRILPPFRPMHRIAPRNRRSILAKTA